MEDEITKLEEINLKKTSQVEKLLKEVVSISVTGSYDFNKNKCLTTLNNLESSAIETVYWEKFLKSSGTRILPWGSLM